MTFLCKDAYAQVADWQPIDDSPAAHENDRVYEPIDPSSEIEIPVLQGASLGMALASLPPKEATAVYLRHILGWPIGGTGGETKMTISVAMGVSTKMVGNYLHDAKEHLLEFCEKELQS